MAGTDLKRSSVTGNAGAPCCAHSRMAHRGAALSLPTPAGRSQGSSARLKFEVFEVFELKEARPRIRVRTIARAGDAR